MSQQIKFWEFFWVYKNSSEKFLGAQNFGPSLTFSQFDSDWTCEVVAQFILSKPTLGALSNTQHVG